MPPFVAYPGMMTTTLSDDWPEGFTCFVRWKVWVLMLANDLVITLVTTRP